MTVRENLAFGLKRHRFAATEVRKQIDDVATALPIADLLERRPQDLSFVERQHVAIARAIVRQPKVLLFDHPFSRIDDESRLKLRNEVASLHERSRTTFLFATHDVDEALSLGEMVAILDDGVVRAFGSPRPSTSGLKASSSQNFRPPTHEPDSRRIETGSRRRAIS